MQRAPSTPIHLRAALLVGAAAALLACGGGSNPDDIDEAGSPAAACALMCQESGYNSWDLYGLDGGAVECACQGGAEPVRREQCHEFCDHHDATLQATLLEEEPHRCVCDAGR